MTPMARTRLAIPLVLLYWLVLVAGLLLYTAIRIDDAAAVVPLWVGAIGGTALGQFVALRDYRLWVAIGLIGAVLTWCVPLMPPELSRTDLWMAFVPATLCGFFSLSDRASLAAFWFPAVIWMLSILDRTSGQAAPDGTGVVLLGALAVLFVGFLRARESRRVALWRTIAAAPLATAKPTAVLKEPPGRQLARGGWALLVSAITFSVTAWVAPHLWQTESFEAGEAQVASPEPVRGLPCCPVAWDAEVTRSRVTEYFDIGRGHDEITGPPRKGIDCQVCEGPAVVAIGGTGSIDGVIAGGVAGGGGVAIDGDPGPYSGSQAGRTGRGDWRPAGEVTQEPWPAPTEYVPSPTEYAPSPTEYAPSPTFPDRPTAAPDPIAPTAEPAPVAPAVPPVADVPTQATPEVDQVSPPGPPEPPGPPHDEQAPEPSPPEATAPVQPPAPPAPERAPAAPPAQVAPQAAMPAPPPASSFQAHRPARATPGAALGPQLLHWIAVIVAAALLFQLTGLALRPLRRWITLHHLRRPFWDETIDQRVSNAWQLALVGLRDAGWRATSAEAPREFARRAGVVGLERCATILERTRHGVALDAGDLAEMATSADAVYRTAHGSLGPVSRAMAWIRWPLT